MTVLRDGYRVPFTDSPPPLSRTPVLFPTYWAGSPRSQALRQEVEGILAKGALEIAEIRVLAFTVVSSWWRRRLAAHDLSLSSERVHPAYTLQDGNSRFCTVICQRGGFSTFPGSERRIFSDPNPSIFKEAIEFHVGGDGLPVPNPVFRTVDRSPGLYQGLRSRVRVGTLSRDPTSPVSGQLVGSCLFGAGSQAVRPVAPLPLSHPRDCDKREEVGSCALADCEVSRHDHQY